MYDKPLDESKFAFFGQAGRRADVRAGGGARHVHGDAGGRGRPRADPAVLCGRLVPLWRASGGRVVPALSAAAESGAAGCELLGYLLP